MTYYTDTGAILTVCFDQDHYNEAKRIVEETMRNDPTYIPWVAISKTAQGGDLLFRYFAQHLDALESEFPDEGIVW